MTAWKNGLWTGVCAAGGFWAFAQSNWIMVAVACVGLILLACERRVG